ncbi:ABC transporter permease [Proteiniclasticum ruminis]|uniref:Osmoprotectant transport system permease protein n=2 Tax=Clostridiaceae TaxID=31979 RepID=A0A1I5CH39_9CLOT|nr:ABC transporter permease [Proteiniclasticum ruminis]SFN86142.1 osmoprotectant transport system permease protein [Proteiniclasticum ruminis]
MADFLERYGEKLLEAIVVHLQYVFVSVGIGLVVALILGILLSRVPKLSSVIIPVVSIFQTIPGLVFIGVLFIRIGIQPATVIIALSIYALFPILKNTYTGILSVDKGLIEAARGCGMSNWQILFKLELPLAMPSIFSGLRMSTIYTVSWAVLAAMIGLGGLGEFIYRGIDTNNNTLIIGGAIPAAVLAILLGFLIDFIQAKVTPRGLKGGRSS